MIELPDRYRVLRHIASGGMASVWEAEDLLLGRHVAVKVLGAQFAADRSARARFQREARTAAQVSDQTHVVTIYDVGEHGDDAFIVMEHFAGGTVADRLRAAQGTGVGRVPRGTALRWLREAAAGLDVAHAAGIVHRDVKPANLLLDAQGRLAVGDFGIARLADDTQMTQTGQVLGTAAYIAPEQALGRPAGPASDRYALAVVAFELLTGSRPFEGGPPSAQARRHADAPPPRASLVAPDLPPALDDVLARGLAKDPRERPRSATELVTAIESALHGSPAVEPGRRLAAAPAVPPRRPATRPQAAGPHAPAAPTPQAPPRAAAPPTLQARPRAAPGTLEARALADGRARARWPALLAAGLTAAAAVALVLLLAGGSREPRREPVDRANVSTAAATAASSRPSTTAAAAPQPAPPPPATADDASPASLNDRGFALLRRRRYGEAIAPLRDAVQGYRSAGATGLPYAYALFNLAVALNRSGNPAEAVPLLRERRKYDDQRKTVQAELDDALAKLDAVKPGPGKARGKHKGKRDRE